MPLRSAPAGPGWQDLPGRLGPLRAAGAEVLRFEPEAFAFLPGLRVALGVVAALVIGLVAGDRSAAAAMAAGALLVAVPTVVGGRRASLGTLALVALTMALSTFVGSVTGQLGWLHTAVLVPWCLAGGLLMALESPLSSIGTQGVAAMIVFGRFPADPTGALALAAYVLAGGAVAVAVLGLTRPPLTPRLQGRALALAAGSLAALSRAGATHRNGIASAEALESAERLLRRGLLIDPALMRSLWGLLDVLRRSRLELLALDGIERQLARLEGAEGERCRAATEEVLTAAGQVLTTIADRLLDRPGAEGTVAPALEAVETALRAARPALAGSTPKPGQGAPGAATRKAGSTGDDQPIATLGPALAGHLVALAGQLRAAADLARPPRPLGHRPRQDLLRSLLPSRPAPLEQLRAVLEPLRAHASLASPIGRHALRLAVVVTVAEVLAEHTPLQRGYWVALTVSVVLRPDFGATVGRGLARSVGTCLGVLLAGLLALAVHPGGPAEVVAIGLLCAAACATFQVSYVVFSGLLTGLVVLLVGVVSPGTLSVALDRLVDTLIGGGLALAASLLWPTWSRTTAPRAFAALALAQRAYLGALLAMATGGWVPATDELPRLARSARRARAAAESAVVGSHSEPAGRRLDLLAGQGVLAALSRLSLTGHALRADLEAGRLPAVPEAGPLATAILAGIDLLTAALEDQRPSGAPVPLAHDRHPRPRGPFPPLRQLHDQLRETLRHRPGLGPLLAETDELVDALDTLAALLGLAPPPGRGPHPEDGASGRGTPAETPRAGPSSGGR